MKKIGFVISSLSSGGAERVLVNLANYLSNYYEITIYTFSNEDSFYKLDEKVKHIKLNLAKKSNNKIESIVNIFKRIKKLKKVFKNEDLIISFMTHTNILSIVASKLLNKKIIISERIEYNFYGKKINFLKRVFYPFANYLVVLTDRDKKNYKYLKNIEVIPNPINMLECNGKKENIILAVGRLNKQKGFDTLIEVYSKIDTNYPLYIVGEGKERKNLENLIKKFNLEKKVFLVGRSKEIHKWYEKASIFVLSSRKEGFPNVLIEAMSCGCACIAFDCPTGPGEIIENYKNGILVENQNKEELKKAIELLINDKNLREKLLKEAVKVREKYSIEKIGERWKNIIQKLV